MQLLALSLMLSELTRKLLVSNFWFLTSLSMLTLRSLLSISNGVESVTNQLVIEQCRVRFAQVVLLECVPLSHALVSILGTGDAYIDIHLLLHHFFRLQLL